MFQKLNRSLQMARPQPQSFANMAQIVRCLAPSVRPARCHLGTINCRIERDVVAKMHIAAKREGRNSTKGSVTGNIFRRDSCPLFVADEGCGSNKGAR